jgi:hypothetical protein
MGDDCMKVLSFDPSGNYNEGKGTTGYAVSNDGHLPHKLGDISSKDYASRQAYWAAHRDLIEQTFPDVLVIESYKLFGHKAKQQTGSSLETPQLIGYMEMVAYDFNIPVVYQDPSTKSRHKDEILVSTGLVEKRGNKFFYKGEMTNLHMRDALRHNIYYLKYGRKK